MSGEAVVNHELKAFRQLVPNMRIAYGQDASLSRLASVCLAGSYIDEANYDLITDTSYEGEQNRAILLVRRISEKAKESPALAHLKTFAQVIREEDSSYNETAKKIDKCETVLKFKSKMINIADSLQASVSRIASRAMARGLISNTEYLLIADPSAKHSERQVVALFDALDRKFQTDTGDPKMIDNFFEVTLQDTDDISGFAGQYKSLKEKFKSQLIQDNARVEGHDGPPDTTSTPPTETPDTSTPPTGALDTSTPPTGALDTSTPPTGAPDTSTPLTRGADTTNNDLPGEIAFPVIENVLEDFKYDKSRHDLKKIYKMNTNPRGYCVVINIRKDREGTDKDVKSLREVFTSLKFKVLVYDDLSRNEILKLVKLVENTDHGRLSCFIMFILAHGNTNGTGDITIKAADGLEVNVPHEIVSSIKNITSLAGKPKLLFFQTCRGDNFDRGIECKTTKFDTFVATDADFLVINATTKGRPAARHEVNGSIFIQHLLAVLRNDAHKDNLDELIKQVRRNVSDTSLSTELQGNIIIFFQTPETIDTLNKTFYFGEPPSGCVHTAEDAAEDTTDYNDESSGKTCSVI